jgi:energy-coupling factor transporter ATP-binding protein EcfA2
MLPNFSVRNFRAFADEVELSMESASLLTTVPPTGHTWVGATEHVAAVYGANASGKTTLIEAIRALSRAIATPGHGAIFQPSSVRAVKDPATEFFVDFVAGGVRYEYEVVATEWGIAREALYSYPKRQRRMVFVRTQAGEDEPLEVVKGQSLKGPTAEVRRITTPVMLLLATAQRYRHVGLMEPARALMDGVGIDLVHFRQAQDQDVIRRVVMEMINAESQVPLVQAMVRGADLGITDIKVRTEKIPERVQRRIRRVLAALKEGQGETDGDVPDLRDVVVFVHRGEDGETFELPLERESSGTLTWLTTVWHALDALRQGTVLLVDELDASLHPDLARYIVEIFQDEQMNEHGAQLIFTTHDVSLLGNAPTKLLHPENVWFTQKDGSGRADLFSLADFDTRPGNNSEKQYLAGRFGAVPDIDDGLLLSYIGERGRDTELVGHDA